MKASKKEKAILQKALESWKKEGLLTEEKQIILNNSIEEQGFNWKALALYSFIFASASIIIAVVSIFADELLIDFFNSLLSGSYLLKSLFFLFVAAGLYFYDYLKNKGKKSYSKQIYGLLACISLALSVGLFAFHIDSEEHSGYLVLLLTIPYAALAISGQRILFWYFAMSALVIGFGLETYFWSEEEQLLLGMNFFLRYTLFSLLLIPISKGLKYNEKTVFLYESTYSIAIALFFFALWILSITGNFSSYDAWLAIKQYEIWLYSMILLLVSAIAISIGIKQEDTFLRNVGVTFIFINLYTRYFEYFWDGMHKAIFFALLGISFWLIGRKAELLWKKSET